MFSVWRPDFKMEDYTVGNGLQFIKFDKLAILVRLSVFQLLVF